MKIIIKRELRKKQIFIIGAYSKNYNILSFISFLPSLINYTKIQIFNNMNYLLQPISKFSIINQSLTIFIKNIKKIV